MIIIDQYTAMSKWSAKGEKCRARPKKKQRKRGKGSQKAEEGDEGAIANIVRMNNSKRNNFILHKFAFDLNRLVELGEGRKYAPYIKHIHNLCIYT